MIITGKEKNLGTSVGRGRLHYLAGSARAERRGQPGCSTPAHLYDDDDVDDLGYDDDDVMMAVFITIFIIIMTIVTLRSARVLHSGSGALRARTITNNNIYIQQRLL